MLTKKKPLFIPIGVDLNEKPKPELRAERAHQYFCSTELLFSALGSHQQNQPRHLLRTVLPPVPPHSVTLKLILLFAPSSVSSSFLFCSAVTAQTADPERTSGDLRHVKTHHRTAVETVDRSGLMNIATYRNSTSSHVNF